MSDFKERLVLERDELAARLQKLEAFQNTDVFLKDIGQDQQVLLFCQRGIMQGYLNILNRRLELLEKK